MPTRRVLDLSIRRVMYLFVREVPVGYIVSESYGSLCVTAGTEVSGVSVSGVVVWPWACLSCHGS